jgi:hypothetical protein
MTRIDAAAKTLYAACEAHRRAERAKHKTWQRQCEARKRYARAIQSALVDELKHLTWRRSSERGYVVTECGPRTRVARLVRPYSHDRVETSLKLMDSFVHIVWTGDPAVRLRIHQESAEKLGITEIGGRARRRRLWSTVHTLLLKRDALADAAGTARVRALVDDIRKEPA